ncbi:hypothetical protein [Agromyces sp. PvR057]|uniref:hypothetical protein n=1 Tax=Agromyces sp. PvR057 TaxID=3156403 RepID=UPI003391C766
MTHITRGFAGVTLGALALSGALAAAPANAADIEFVTGIAPNESSYLGWHEGYVNAEPAFALRWDGLELGLGGVDSQVLNGLVASGAPGLPITGTDLGSLITSSETVVLEGETYLQVPVTWNGGWSTLRPGTPSTEADGDYALTDEWVSSRPLGAIAANTPTALSDILAALDAAGTVAYSGFGVLSTDPATVESLTWNGTTNAFWRSVADIPVTSTVYVTAGEIRPDESTYPGWHEGYENATPAFAVTGAGLELGIGTKSQIINGLAEPIVDADLASLIGSAGVVVASGSVSYQVPIFFGAENTFTTLRPATPDAGFGLDALWVSSKAISPAIAANTPVVLGDLIEAIEGVGSVTVLAFGVQAEQPATVETITFNGVEYSFLPAPVVPSEVTPGGEAAPAGALAATGFEGAGFAALGGLVVAAGVALTVLARRRAGQSA